MKRLVVGGLAALIAGCGSPQPDRPAYDETRFVQQGKIIYMDELEHKAEYFSRGMHFKQKALETTNEQKRAEYLAYAISDFTSAAHHNQKKHESLTQKADCLSIGNSTIQAIETINHALEIQKTPEAWNTKGNIFSRTGMHDGSIEYYTKAIELEDKPAYRWNRYSANMDSMIDNEGLHVEKLENAIKDARAYIKFIPDEPDGYAALGISQNILGLALKDNDKIKEALDNLKKALDMNKPFQRPRHKKEDIKKIYEETQKIMPQDESEDF